MKRFLCLISLFSCVFLALTADDQAAAINLNQHGHDDHYNFPIPADMPDAYYNNVSQTIIIDGTGEVTYYDVEIISLTSMNTVISTQVNGYYDTIDVSSLPEAEYCIFIYSPTGNTFEGFFEIY